MKPPSRRNFIIAQLPNPYVPYRWYPVTLPDGREIEAHRGSRTALRLRVRGTQGIVDATGEKIEGSVKDGYHYYRINYLTDEIEYDAFVSDPNWTRREQMESANTLTTK